MFGGGEADTVQPHHLHDLSLLSLYRCSSSECGPQLLWLIGRNVIRCNDIQRRIYFISRIREEKPFEVLYTNNCTAVDVTWKLFRPHVSLVPLPSSSWSIWFDLIWSPTSKVLLIGCLAERGHLSLLNPQVPSTYHLIHHHIRCKGWWTPISYLARDDERRSSYRFSGISWDAVPSILKGEPGCSKGILPKIAPLFVTM